MISSSLTRRTVSALRRLASSSSSLASRRRAAGATLSSSSSSSSLSWQQTPTRGAAAAISSRYNCRSFSTTDDADDSNDETVDPLKAPRDAMPFDVLIVGGGPAGLAAAIRLRQLGLEKANGGDNKELSVCVIEKGNEIGAHILSGNVFDPKALHELFPDMAGDDPKAESHWTQQLYEAQASHATPVQQDEFMLLTESGKLKVPGIFLPPQLNNDGNYVISLGQLCRWMAAQAEELGVEVYPGFAASEVLVNESTGAVEGIATRDVGLDKKGQPKATFERGVELKARQTLFAEGARGSCTEWLVDHFDLRSDDDKHPQTYGLGLKEVWQVPKEQFQAGLVLHTLGYPLQGGPMDKVYGGCFLYHQEPDLVLLGMVVGLNYANPYLNPYKEFQKWKTHPEIRKHVEGGSCLSYGARVLNEGGYHSIPELSFPGGALLGCSAGFLNNVKIKGTHTAIKSGMLAAEAAFDALQAGGGDAVAETGELPENEDPIQLTSYGEAIEKSWIHDELYEVRNAHEAFNRWGVGGGMIYTGLTAHITKGREPWTLKHTGNDCETTGKAEDFEPIDYPAPDGVLTFDLLTNLQRSGTYHEDDQPSHLRIKPDLDDVPKDVSWQVYGAPESRFCPAGVYEYVDNPDDDGGPDKKLVINAQNCIHCKCCSIKMPKEYIDWTVPEGGGGPQYQVM